MIVLLALVVINVAQLRAFRTEGGGLMSATRRIADARPTAPTSARSRPRPATARPTERPTTFAGIALRTPYWVFTGGARADLPLPAGLDGGLVGVAARRHEPGRRLGPRQLRDPRELPGRHLGLPRQLGLRVAAHRGADARGLAARRVRVRAVQVPRQGPAVPVDARDPDGAVRDPADPALRAAQRGGALELARRRRPRAHDVPAAVLDVHDAHLVRVDPARARRGGDGRRMQRLARAVARARCRRSSRASSRSGCSRSSRRGTTSSRRSSSSTTPTG